MKDKILIFGRGFIGTRLQEEFGCEITGKKIYSYNDIKTELDKFKPGVIINCIGNVGRNVDECERNPDKTLMANTFVPIIMAEAAIRHNIRFVDMSTGCIYHYDYSLQKPIDEDEEPDFFDLFYSRAKIYSERALLALSRKFPVLILRIRIPLDDRPHPRNIIDKLLEYKTIIDLPNSVTYIPDFIKAVKHLISKNARGIYNVVNKGYLRYPELMDVYRKYAPDFKYKVIDFKDLKLVRTNLKLSTRKLEDCGFKVRDIHDVLEECVINYLKRKEGR